MPLLYLLAWPVERLAELNPSAMSLASPLTVFLCPAFTVNIPGIHGDLASQVFFLLPLRLRIGFHIMA